MAGTVLEGTAGVTWSLGVPAPPCGLVTLIMPVILLLILNTGSWEG